MAMIVGQKVGPFHIEKEIGSGAMGTVYRARFDKDGKPIPVALKVIALGLLGNEGAMARFERETEILKQLRHKHIVRLIAFGRYKQTPFIAMEYIDGEPLDRVLTRRNRMAWEDVVEYGKQLCDALQYAHEKGILHRDLKPSNLMVTREDTLKLTDFGIAKDMDVTALTGQNSTIGTAAYMSPEQCKGDRHLTNKSDLYSLGVVLYELLTGKKPFTADTTVDMFLKHVNEKPVRPSKHVPDLPIWLDNLVMFLLEKDRDRRPLDAATVGTMLADIEEKVRTQHSAGADVANARRIDRPLGENELDETDREAARTLRTSAKTTRTKRSKKAKKGRPLSEQAWLKAIPLVAVLGVIVYLLYSQLKPASQEDLFKAWKTASSPDAKLDRAERYLSRFGTDGSEQTEQVRASLREIRGERLQTILDKRFNKTFAGRRISTAQDNEDPQAYAAAWSALEAEEKGELAQADGFWKQVLARGPTIADDYGDGWLWLAEKRIAAINGLDARLAEVRGEVMKSQAQELPWKYDPTQPESVARLAVRYDGERHLKAGATSIDPNRKPLPFVKDVAKARRAWAALADLTRNKSEHHGLYLLAVRERERYADVKPDPALAERVPMLTNLMTAVRGEWERVGTNPDLRAEWRDCRNRCRDVIELYGDEADDPVKKLVGMASELLKVMEPND